MKKVLSLILSIILVFSLIPTGVFNVAAAEIATGTTGECIWSLNGTVLTIRGEGAMGNYNNTNTLSPWGTSITEVIIESGVTSVGAYAFYRCTVLKSISIPSSLKSIGSNAFYYCESLPGVVIPDGVTSIGSEAFYKCSKISEITLPDSLISIGKDAFSLCRFASITIPENVSSIGAGAFGYCSLLTSIYVDENNATYYSANNCIIKKSTNSLVAGCKSSVIPNGVTSIEDDAFNGCSAYGDFTIPDSVTRIGGWAFSGSNFTSITLPKSVTYIAYGAFYLCRNLTDVYYSGNRVDKTGIDIGGGNEDLKNATWHYSLCENDAHIFDYVCTTTCKNCDYIRISDTEHTFDDDCDEVCNVCGTHRIAKHIFEQLGENTAKCKVCNTSKSFDFIINTDGTITLSYEALKEFDFAMENTSIAKIVNISSSVISSGTYYKKVSSAKISPVFIGETKVNVIDTNGVLLTSSTLLVVEGEHQTQLAEVITPATCTDNGTGTYRCKFCNYEEQGVIYAPVHVEIVDAYKAPTCTETGLTEGKHCLRCNEVLVAQETISATGHTWENETPDENENLHYECSVCHDKITKININNVSVKIDKNAFQYHLTFPDIPVSYSGEELVLNEDYELIYSLGERTYQETHSTSTCIWALGTCTVTVRGINKYFGEMLFDVDVGKFDMSKAHLMTTWIYEGNGCYGSSSYDMKNFEYDGTVKKQSGYRVCDDNDTISAEHYEITYKNNLAIGTATMIITGKGDYYTGTFERQFRIYASDNCDQLYSDVPGESWQFVFVKYVVEKGLMAGKGVDVNGRIKFAPNDPITREEFAQVLYNAENKPSVSITNRFPDVKNDWYKNAVLWANQNNIANGMGNGNFGVGKNITRQDLALMLYKYAALKGLDLTAPTGEINQYADGSMVSGYAQTAMNWAVKNGVLSGKGTAGEDISSFRLDPAGTATRAECAAMLKNFMEAFGL